MTKVACERGAVRVQLAPAKLRSMGLAALAPADHLDCAKRTRVDDGHESCSLDAANDTRTQEGLTSSADVAVQIRDWYCMQKHRWQHEKVLLEAQLRDATLRAERAEATLRGVRTAWAFKIG